MMHVLFLLNFYLITSLSAYIVRPGPVVQATKGAIWPKPLHQLYAPNGIYYIINPHQLQFNSATPNCQILQDAINRYWKLINASNNSKRRGHYDESLLQLTSECGENCLGVLKSIDVVLNGTCNDKEYPDLYMDEKYELLIQSVAEESSYIKSKTVWGLLRGLETFSQLIHYGDDTYSLIINSTSIVDYPRFPHRGLLLDTSRHFLPLHIIMQNIDAMSFNKFNVLHWHIVDDHSFPYQSIKYPSLSAKGAYHPISKIYTQTDVAKVIEYGRNRGVRVMPEFDTPGHTRSWGEGILGILTACYKNGQATGEFGPMDPTQNNLYEFLEDFFEEINQVFPDNYLHLGGDEVEFECWESNPGITEFMNKMNITGDYVALESYFIQKLLNIVNGLNVKSLVWEEVFVNGVELPNETIVHVWMNDGFTVLDKVTKAGKPALLSSCWYLDHLATGGDWKKFYDCDPYNFNATQTQKELILGGEACMWAESVNEYNIGSRIWPRASATAEKLWSAHNADNYTEAAKRLEEHTCRMNNRGIPAQPPNGPGVCL